MREVPILIVGAGPVGLCLALALRRIGRDCMVIDSRPATAAPQDARALALSHGSRQLLERIGVWPHLHPTAIGRIHVSHRGHFGRSLLSAAEHALPALGYVQAAGELVAALAEQARSEGIRVEHEQRLINVAAGGEDALVGLAHGELHSQLRARLVAHAEGAPGDGTGIARRDYAQQAVVTVASTKPPASDMAFERFTASGPLALLPMNGRYSVVYTAAADEARALAALDDGAFLAQLQRQFGDRLRFTGVDARVLFPLALRYRRSPIARREVWLGNAAQTLHPVAGQGFNLALRDVWTLVEKMRAGDVGDAGADGLLARYVRSRRVDRAGVIGITDTLVRAFSNDFPPLALARAGVLLALDLTPPMRNFFARRMMFGARGI